MPRKKKADGEAGEPVVDYRHKNVTRLNIPPAGLAARGNIARERKIQYAYNPHLAPVLRFDATGRADRISQLIEEAGRRRLEPDELKLLQEALHNHEPWLEWAGKREQQWCVADPVALHIHERISTQAILRVARRLDVQRDLFADPEHEYREAVQFYRHPMDWTNRMILGDSLAVMASLARREALAGKVRMIYVDPPYGIKYASNFQPEVGRRDVKDRDEDLTREPEMVKAYRDTWTLGVHSYLSYLRDRFLLCRELLADTGSIFVQISDTNVHRVRTLMDEVFGASNFVSLISYKTTQSAGAKTLDTSCDYILWYCRDAEKIKYRELHKLLKRGEKGATRYDFVENSETGETRRLTEEEQSSGVDLPNCRFFTDQGLTSRGEGSEKTMAALIFEGERYFPPAGHWRTTADNTQNRLIPAGRVIKAGTNLRFKKYFDDFGCLSLTNLWDDVGGRIQSREDPKVFVVQTSNTIIERCMLMTTDPGDLVLDPTCGSGTTAYVAEQWGRRWITIDLSRVALAIARQRLLTAKFDYCRLRPTNAEDVERNPDGVWLSNPERNNGSAGVPPANHGGQDARPPFLNPFETIEMHEHHLPHWQQGEVFYFVTWRLADSLPREKLNQWVAEKEAWLRLHPQPWDEATTEEYHWRFGDVIDRWLDAGEGSCLLRRSDVAQVVERALLHFDGQRYDMDTFVVMPNHVHVLFRLREGAKLQEVVHSWKSYTAKVINRLTKSKGIVWQEDYWDRMIRNARHLEACRAYIRDNPRKAGLRDGDFVLFERSAGVPPANHGGQDARPPVKWTFDCRTVPHITLRSIAQNPALDPIFEKWEPILAERLAALNRALAGTVTDALRRKLALKLTEKARREGKRSVTDADRRRWQLPEKRWEEWEVPFDADPDWPEALQEALAEYRQAWRQKMGEVNACIAARADREELVDQPFVEKGRVRVSGPFTMEEIIPAEESIDEEEPKESPIAGAPEQLETFGEEEGPVETEAQNAEAYLDRMIRLLREDGVRFPENKVMKFSALEALADGSILHAKGTWGEGGDERQVAVMFGPQYGPMTAIMVEDGIRIAARRGFDDLVFAAFSFDGAAQAAIQEDPDPKLRIHMAQIRPDVNMGDLLKTTVSSQLFTVSGSPRTRMEPVEDGQYVVHMEGVDIYDPVTNTVRSTGAEKVAAWFLDSDYDGRCFCVCQAFFPDRSAWEKLGKALGGALDEDAFAKLSGTVSLSFLAGGHRRIAVKVIDPRGNEVLRVHRLGAEHA